MGETEIINELKRLSDVITGLEDMIALQNQANTSLLNSVTLLTTVTGQLVEVNVRALNTTDKAHTPLPDDSIQLPAGPIPPIAVAAGGTYSIDLTDADWGAGRDFYLSFLVIQYSSAVGPFFRDYNHGVEVDLYEPTTNERYLSKGFFGQGLCQTSLYGGSWYFYETIQFNQLRRVLSTETLRVEGFNHSNVAVMFGQWIIGILR